MIGRNASEGVEPRNAYQRTGPRVSSPGSRNRRARYRRVCGGVPGSKSVAGHRTVCVGTWETRAAPEKQAPDKLKRRGRRMAARESDQLVAEV